MRLLFFIFVLNCTQVFGQSNPFSQIPSASDIIDREDTFEIKYECYIGLKVRVDTLPLLTNDESSGWRNVQLVTYYFDSDTVRMIAFRDGQRENYFFFFNGPDLGKVRIGYKESHKTNTSYYYSVAENRNAQSKMNISFQNGIVKKDKFSLLAAGQALKTKFYPSQ